MMSSPSASEITADWADLSEVPGATTSWAHNGIVVTSAGELVGYHAGQLVAFDRTGQLARAVRPGLTEAHGITLVYEDEVEYLWVSDPGFVFAAGPADGDEQWVPLFGKGVDVKSGPPRVVKMTLAGEIVAELPLPARDAALPPGMMGDYCPCGTAIDEARFGGSGDVWVADGYGAGLVHRFDRHGEHRLTLSGEEGGGRFLCPHAVFIDRRGGKTPELLIADRENRRVQVYDLEGSYLRTFGVDFLNSPSGFAVTGELLVVAELYGRLTVVDGEDAFVGYIGAEDCTRPDAGWPERPGWPNALNAQGRIEAAQHPALGAFNSPHSLAVDADGNLYVSEWLIGGRYSKVRIADVT
jgi:hypothetical protein